MSDIMGSSGLQKAAESALLQVAARWLIIAICATALPLGAWLGNRVATAMDEIGRKVDKLVTDVAVLKNDVSYLKQRTQP